MQCNLHVRVVFLPCKLAMYTHWYRESRVFALLEVEDSIDMTLSKMEMVYVEYIHS